MPPRKPHARETDEAPESKAAPVASPPPLPPPAPAPAAPAPAAPVAVAETPRPALPIAMAPPPPGPSPDGGPPRGPDANDRYERVKREEVFLSKLQELTMADLLKYARQEGIKEIMGLKKQEIIYKIIP